MKTAVGMAVVLGFATAAFADGLRTEKPDKYSATLSGRVGVESLGQKIEIGGNEVTDLEGFAPTIGVQADGALKLTGNLYLKGRGSVDAGYVDGTINDKDFNQSTLRFRIQVAAAYALELNNFVLTPFAGFGLWKEAHSEPDPKEFTHIEELTCTYAALGVRGELITDKYVYFAQAEFHLPIEVTITALGGFDFETDAAKDTTMFTLDAGVMTAKYSFGIFVESLVIDTEDDLGGTGRFIGEIDAVQAGIKVGLRL